jgi:O-antigen/teichoic acid export membrane protein
MGVVIRQSLKGSIYSYLGAAIGFVNIGILMPMLLQTNQIGLINVLISLSMMLSQLGTLGLADVTIRFFPFFRTPDKRHHGFVKLMVYSGLIGFILSVLLFFVFKNQLVVSNIDKSPLLAENISYIIPLVFASLFYLLLDGYFRAIYKASTATFFKDLLFRVLVFADLIMYYLKWIDFDTFLNIYVIAFATPTFLMLIYMGYIGEFRFASPIKEPKPEILKQMRKMAFFSFISGFSSVVILNIDKYFVNEFLDLNAAGVYSIAFFFGSMVMIPAKALRRISIPVITDAFKNNDLKTIKDVYNKTTMTMLLVSVLLFVLITVNLDNLMRLLPNDYSTGKWSIFIISLAFVLNQAVGVSGQIILYSEYYKMNTLIMLFMIGLIVISNFLLIPALGISGAALATAITYLVVGIFRWAFVWVKFNMQPFNFKHLILTLFSVVLIVGFQLIPELPVLYDALIRSTIIILAYFIFLYLSKISPEFFDLLKNLNPYKRNN